MLFCPFGFPTERDLVVDLADDILEGDNLQTSVSCMLGFRRIDFPFNDCPRASDWISPSCIHVRMPYCTVTRLYRTTSCLSYTSVAYCWSERSAYAALGCWHKRRWPLFLVLIFSCFLVVLLVHAPLLKSQKGLSKEFKFLHGLLTIEIKFWDDV